MMSPELWGSDSLRTFEKGSVDRRVDVKIVNFIYSIVVDS